MQTFRGFIAIDVPVTDQLLSLKDKLASTSARLKLVSPENIHITLKFLGETPLSHIDQIETIMKNAVTLVTPHTVLLKGTGVFPSESYIKVIWIGLQQTDQLAIISKTLNHELMQYGFKKEKRGFSPHLTLARMKSASGKEEILTLLNQYNEILFAEIPVNTIVLKKSTLTPTGPIYETLRTVPITP